MSKNQYKNAYKVFVSGMRNGSCLQVSEWFDVGAKSEKHAIELLKTNHNKTLKYRVQSQYPTDLGIPVGTYIKRK